MRFPTYTIAGGFLFMLKLHLSLFSLLVKQIHRKEMHSYETTKARSLYYFQYSTDVTPCCHNLVLLLPIVPYNR